MGYVHDFPGRFFRYKAMSQKIGEGFWKKRYVSDFWGLFFRQSAMSPNIANLFNSWLHIIVQSTSTNQLN